MNAVLTAAVAVLVILGAAVVLGAVGWLIYGWGQLDRLDELDADERHWRETDEAAAWSQVVDIVDRYTGGESRG